MTKWQEHLRRRVAAAAPRAAAAAAAALSLCLVCLTVSALAHTVLVQDSEGAECLLMTPREEPAALLAMAGVEPEEGDRVSVDERGDGSLRVLLQRTFPVRISVDGGQLTARASGGTVAELLREAGVTLGPDDEVTPRRGAAVTEETETVSVTRVTYTERKVREEVPFEVQYLDETNETEGDYIHETLEQEGKNGLQEVTYRRKFADGKDLGEQPVRTRAITEMQPEIHRKYRSDAISPLPPPEGITVTDHVPSSYTTVYSMRSTGYSSPRGRGASGLGLYVGTFACDPNVIPYGTKVYIASPDGSFVYGWAIATDTGTFALSNPMQVDLFYSTYADSAAHGVRQVNVYIP